MSKTAFLLLLCSVSYVLNVHAMEKESETTQAEKSIQTKNDVFDAFNQLMRSPLAMSALVDHFRSTHAEDTNTFCEPWATYLNNADYLQELLTPYSMGDTLLFLSYVRTQGAKEYYQKLAESNSMVRLNVGFFLSNWQKQLHEPDHASLAAEKLYTLMDFLFFVDQEDELGKIIDAVSSKDYSVRSLMPLFCYEVVRFYENNSTLEMNKKIQLLQEYQKQFLQLDEKNTLWYTTKYELYKAIEHCAHTIKNKAEQDQGWERALEKNSCVKALARLYGFGCPVLFAYFLNTESTQQYCKTQIAEHPQELNSLKEFFVYMHKEKDTEKLSKGIQFVRSIQTPSTQESINAFIKELVPSLEN